MSQHSTTEVEQAEMGTTVDDQAAIFTPQLFPFQCLGFNNLEDYVLALLNQAISVEKLEMVLTYFGNHQYLMPNRAVPRLSLTIYQIFKREDQSAHSFELDTYTRACRHVDTERAKSRPQNKAYHGPASITGLCRTCYRKALRAGTLDEDVKAFIIIVYGDLHAQYHTRWENRYSRAEKRKTRNNLRTPKSGFAPSHTKNMLITHKRVKSYKKPNREGAKKKKLKEQRNK